MTGTNIPRYHNHPTSRYGRRRRTTIAPIVTPIKMDDEPITCHSGKLLRGCL